MELNLMIIGAMVLLMVIGGLAIEAINKAEEKMRKRKIKDIWYRV